MKQLFTLQCCATLRVRARKNVLVSSSGRASYTKYITPVIKALCILTCLTSFTSNAYASPQTEREVSVCKGEKTAIFTLKLLMASHKEVKVGNLVNTKLGIKYNLTTVEFETGDNRMIKGYKIRLKDSNPTKAVLFAHGNAMKAFQTIESTLPIVKEGFDVYTFDYRGVGLSKRVEQGKRGKTRFRAILEDYNELATGLKSSGKYSQFYGYGASFGGILLLNTQGQTNVFNHLFIDGVPSHIRHFLKCPVEYDPVSMIPTKAEKITALYGSKDNFDGVEFLAKKINTNGGNAVKLDNHYHPYMESKQATFSRFQVIASFFSLKANK